MKHEEKAKNRGYQSVLGIQISSVKPMLTTPQGVQASFAKFQQAGFRAAQLQWIDPTVPDATIAAALQQSQLHAVSLQDFTHAILAEKQRYIATCLAAGCADLTVSGIPADAMHYQGCKTFAAEMRAFSAELAAQGLSLSFHPRAQEYADIGGVSGLDLLLDQAGGAVRLCLDGYHAHLAGHDPADYIATYHDILTGFHFKDSVISQGKTVLMPIGQGSIDWANTLHACRKYQVQHCYVEQETWSGDPFTALKQSFDYLLGTGYFTAG